MMAAGAHAGPASLPDGVITPVSVRETVRQTVPARSAVMMDAEKPVAYARANWRHALAGSVHVSRNVRVRTVEMTNAEVYAGLVDVRRSVKARIVFFMGATRRIVVTTGVGALVALAKVTMRPVVRTNASARRNVVERTVVMMAAEVFVAPVPVGGSA